MSDNLIRRVYEQHKQELTEGFTKRYVVHHLVWFESTPSIQIAIRREKQVKNRKRQ